MNFCAEITELKLVELGNELVIFYNSLSSFLDQERLDILKGIIITLESIIKEFD
jgi:hypothetical protein